MKENGDIYDLLVYIGRFQPFHKGHRHVIDTALGLADHVLILVGSAFSPRTAKNPFNFQERLEFVDYDLRVNPEVTIAPLPDCLNDEAWCQRVVAIAKGVCAAQLIPYERSLGAQIEMIGHSKDESSYYLELFKPWPVVEVPNLQGINATDIRQAYFNSERSIQFFGGLHASHLGVSAHRHLFFIRTNEDRFQPLKAIYTKETPTEEPQC